MIAKNAQISIIKNSFYIPNIEWNNMNKLIKIIACSLISSHFLFGYVEDSQSQNKQDKSGCAPSRLQRQQSSTSDYVKPPIIIDGIRDPKSPFRK